MDVCFCCCFVCFLMVCFGWFGFLFICLFVRFFAAVVLVFPFVVVVVVVVVVV